MAAGRRRQGRSARPTTPARAPGRRPAASARSARSTPTATTPKGGSSRRSINALTRRERHEELIQYAIDGAVAQVKRAYEIAGGKGAININVLWEMGGAQRVLEGVLERTKGLVAGVTCGAGMPYKLTEIAASHGVTYLPIISSGRAFRALWKRAYHKAAEWLGAVVYEDPWLAGGHNGLQQRRGPARAAGPLSAGQGIARRDARGRHLRQRADRHGRRRVAARRMGRLDRQSRARPDRVPVRHAAAADPGKPDPARVEGAADDARGGRHPAPPILADRLLFLGGAQPVPALARGALASARSPSPRKRSATMRSSSTSGSAPSKNYLGHQGRPAARPRMVCARASPRR